MALILLTNTLLNKAAMLAEPMCMCKSDIASQNVHVVASTLTSSAFIVNQ